ncbi:MAG: hypothetical protein IKP88_14770 [Lachnospiraceae bacterium]|nr:hypothetical protein [Lachnospiraceae bacterium]
MNVYQRLINILAETINPEYWSVSELLHYLKLSQNEFVRQSRIFRKNAKLALSFEKNPDDWSDSPTFRQGEYEIPSDCLEIVSIQWNGKPLDKKGLTYLETRYTGTRNQSEIKGLGRYKDNNGWREESGEPDHWIYDNKNIRLFPCPNEIPSAVMISGNISSSNKFAVTFTNPSDYELALKVSSTDLENNIAYIKDNRWLKAVRYYYCKYNSVFYLSFEKETLDYLRKMISDGYTIAMFCYPKSEMARADYIYEPEFRYESPDELDEENAVFLEIPKQWHESVACYAAYLALSKEGSKTQDIEKANIYLARFSSFVEQAMNLANSEIDIDPMVSMPFII